LPTYTTSASTPSGLDEPELGVEAVPLLEHEAAPREPLAVGRVAVDLRVDAGCIPHLNGEPGGVSEAGARLYPVVAADLGDVVVRYLARDLRLELLENLSKHGYFSASNDIGFSRLTDTVIKPCS